MSDLESPAYLASLVFISSLVLAFGVGALQRTVRQADEQADAGTSNFTLQVLFNWILAAVAATPFAFATSSRDPAVKDLIETHGLSTLSLGWTLVVAIVMSAGQLALKPAGASRLAAGFVVNWLLAGAAIIAYLALWLILWIAGVVGALSGAGCVNC